LSDATNTTACAISSAVPARLSATCSKSMFKQETLAFSDQPSAVSP
jgi:hypothetical protein